MSVATAPAPPPAAARSRPEPVPRLPQQPGGVHRFTLDEYHAMIASGILREDDRVELLDGYIVESMSINPPHAAGVYLCSQLLRSRVDQQASLVFSERPIALPPASEPEPDVVIVAFQPDFYATAHPTPADVTLVVEVADESLERDREHKLPRYAEAGLPEYWIVNLRDGQLERYTDPRPARPEVGQSAAYAKTEVFGRGQVLNHETLGELTVDDLLPAAASQK